MSQKHTILLSLSTLSLALATGVMWHFMPAQKGFSSSDIKIGQTRAETETAFAGQGFFGRTCFGELAVYGDREEEGREQHVMALMDEATQTVAAVEVQQVETPVSSAAQCAALVRTTAEQFGAEVQWQSMRPAKYSAGATQRYFLRQRGPDGHMREIWGEHKGAAGFQTCDLYWRTSVPGREQLSTAGEWHIPGDRSVPFDPFKAAGLGESQTN